MTCRAYRKIENRVLLLWNRNTYTNDMFHPHFRKQFRRIDTTILAADNLRMWYSYHRIEERMKQTKKYVYENPSLDLHLVLSQFQFITTCNYK
jgi:hypothetical protein